MISFNNTISERDMDLLFAEAILTDLGFCKMLLEKTDLSENPFRVLDVELSKSDSELGESDITVVVEIDGVKYGLLIEDKIDAIAMPEQHDRYVKRGEKGVRVGEFSDYRVFIVCPEKYYKNDNEAKLYEHYLLYEECHKYFKSQSDVISQFRSQQLEQAIDRTKKPSVISVDKQANAFLKQYIAYQKEHYPSLDLSTREDRNGWWTDYRTELGPTVYINHKLREGYVDLTFLGASKKIDQMKIIADWARNHKLDVAVVKTKKSAMIRMHVPRLDILNGFEHVGRGELDQCFDAIKELTDFANVIEMTYLTVYEQKT